MISQYPKIYHVGAPESLLLFDKPYLVQEKIDGSQFSFMKSDITREVYCRSKSKQIDMDFPEKLFSLAVQAVLGVSKNLMSGWIYRGEFLKKPKHNTLAYNRIPPNHIILFDIETPDGFLGPMELHYEAERVGLEAVPLYAETLDTPEAFKKILERESCLGGQKIEGIVIKSLELPGPHGGRLMAKYVSEAYKEVHRGDWRERNPNRDDVVCGLINKYRTPARWAKAVQHLNERNEIEGTPKDIGKLFKEVNEDVKNECGTEIREELFSHFWSKIARGLTNGMPEWYKDQLLQRQFEVDDAV